MSETTTEEKPTETRTTGVVAASARLKHQYNFTRVPNEIIDHPMISSTAKMIWIKLWSYCYKRNESSAFPGMETIADSLNCSVKTIYSHRRQLEEWGLLKVEHRGLAKTNLYKLYCPEPDFN